MNDMSKAIVPKSDQLNTDDLIGGAKTITVTKVAIKDGGEQPVSISFNGDNGKPYKPCKSMCRVLVESWGADANKYVGRSLTLYRDPSVTWAGLAVGGIRISHLSHITEAKTMALTATKQTRKPFTVRPLPTTPGAPTQAAGVFSSSDERKAWLAAQAKVLDGFKAPADIESWKSAEATKIAELGDKQKEWLDAQIAAAAKRLSDSPPSDDCKTCGGTGVTEDADGKGPCADCQGG